MLASAHDLSDGGLAIALAEACLYGGRGCAVALRGDSFTALFSESAARALVSVVPGREREFAALAEEHGVPATVLGVTTGDSLTVEGAFQIPLTELGGSGRRPPGYQAGLDRHPPRHLRLAPPWAVGQLSLRPALPWAAGQLSLRPARPPSCWTQRA